MEDKNPLILAVDDNNVNLTLIRSQLHFQPYDVITATSGKEALQLIGERHPDLVLLDIMMPDMDGMEVLDKIRENPATETLPVIMLTALTEAEVRADATIAGADGYLTKPLIMSILLNELKRVLGR